MKLLIDNLSALAGWSAAGGAALYGVNELPDYIAGNNSSSIIFNFNGTGSYVEKTYGTDISDYDEIVLWIFSASLGENKSYQKASDYSYKIALSGTDEFYLSAQETFYWVKINVENIDTLEKIRITALTDTTDHVFVSYMIAVKDQFPFDIFEGLKEQIEIERDAYYNLVQIGTITGSADDTSISFAAAPDYLDRYCLVKIDDGVNSEIHQLIERRGNIFDLGKLEDGTELLHDYDAAPVYLYYPVAFGTTQKEILLPSITFWGFTGGGKLITNELDKLIDSHKVSGSFLERQVGQYVVWDILIDCECREEWELLEDLSSIVRKAIGKKIAWVNGRRVFIESTGPPTELYPNEAVNIIPKIQYPVNITIREELWQAIELPPTVTIAVDANIVEQGEL